MIVTHEKFPLYIMLAFVLLFGLYGLIRGYRLLTGPSINITFPVYGQILPSQNYVLRGTAKNVAFIYLNDRKIFTNKEGVIEEYMAALPGYNVITLKANDKFGREVSKKIAFYATASVPRIASTTASSTLQTKYGEEKTSTGTDN